METLVTTSVPAAGVVLEQVESVGVILLVERPRSRSLVEVRDVLVLTILDTEKLGDVVDECGRNVDDFGVHSVMLSGVTIDLVNDVDDDKSAIFVVYRLIGETGIDVLTVLDLCRATGVDLGKREELDEL